MKRKTPTKVTFTFKNGADKIELRMVAAFMKRLVVYQDKKAKRAPTAPGRDGEGE